MRVTEQQTPEGMVTAQISALEYSADYYTNPVSTETPDIGFIDLPRLPIIPPIYIPDVYQGNYANVAALPGSVFGNVVTNDAMKTFGAGTQLADNPQQDTATHPTPTTNIGNLIDPESYDITDADIGDYELTAGGQLVGTLTSAYDFSYQGNVDVSWANATSTASQTFSSTLNYSNFPATTPPPPTALSLKVNLDPTVYFGASAADMKPQTANVVLRGKANSGITGAEFSNLGYQFLRVTKGEK